jgi:hypothetical protein
MPENTHAVKVHFYLSTFCCCVVCSFLVKLISNILSFLFIHETGGHKSSLNTPLPFTGASSFVEVSWWGGGKSCSLVLVPWLSLQSERQVLSEIGYFWLN